MPNPFYTSGSMPSAYFVGREQTVENVFKHIKNRSNSSFHGISGIGKSSLLRFICDPVAWQKYGLGQDISDFYPVFIDCLSIAPFTPQKFFRKILGSLRQQFKEHTLLKTMADSLLAQDEINQSDLGTILGQIERDKKLYYY
jgi:DNA replication protein DnaC